MPELGRTKPCAECPWLRKACRGYLGQSHAEEFYRSSVTQEAEMPCHMTIDYGDPDWRETQLPGADFCAGNLIFFRNNHKGPRRPSVAAAVRKVLPSKHVFAWAIEFFTHHMPFDSPEDIQTAVNRAQFPFTEDM